MGGLSTEREALIALECNVDFVQSAYFAQPSVDAVHSEVAASAMDALTAASRERIAARDRAQSARLEPYVSGLEHASVKLVESETLVTATSELLQLADTARCFLLDQAERQIDDNIVPIVRTSQRTKRFSPLLHSEGASWERRPYFIEALRALGRVHLTAPYL